MMKRTDFIHTIIRVFILGIIAVLTGFFAIKDKIGNPGECSSDFQCSGCNKINGCMLPQSANYKKNERS